MTDAGTVLFDVCDANGNFMNRFANFKRNLVNYISQWSTLRTIELNSGDSTLNVVYVQMTIFELSDHKLNVLQNY